ncbi:unnamed protein product [Ophioblennius macclurei]
MSWFGSAWLWLSLKAGLLWRCPMWLWSKLLGLFSTPALLDRDRDDYEDLDSVQADRDPETGRTAAATEPSEENEGGHGEGAAAYGGGQYGAAGTKRAAASREEAAGKRVKTEVEVEVEEEVEGYGVEPTDEYFCEYDSTWEDEGAEKKGYRKRRSRGRREWSYYFEGFERAARDMQNFRRGYPNQGRSDTSTNTPNLNFYLGRTCSQPDGVFIYEFHKDWYQDYENLERRHTFIQWLFPLQERGMNYQAPPLTQNEVKEFCDNAQAKENLLRSYKLMLDFYGIKLYNEKTGEVKRADNFEKRFENMNNRTHNNLRITRILKCLGTLGYQHYQYPLVHFFLHETLVERKLPNVKESVLNYFVFSVLNKDERRKLIKFAYSNYHHREEFVWCPKKVQMMWSQQGTCDVRGAHDISPSPESWSPEEEDSNMGDEGVEEVQSKVQQEEEEEPIEVQQEEEEEPIEVQHEGQEKPSEVQHEGQEKPSEVQQEEEEEPIEVQHEGEEKPTEVQHKDEEEPTEPMT